jgi:hypothetical protein
MPARPIIRLRKLCLALPEAHEVEAWGHPTFRVRNKIFATYSDGTAHDGNGRVSICVKAAPGDQEMMINAAPGCFFRPPYVGHKGWVGIWLDEEADWENVAEFLRDSYKLIAPKRLCVLLDADSV